MGTDPRENGHPRHTIQAHEIMKKIYDSKPENKSGILLLFWAVLVLGITGYAGALFIFDATDVYDFIVIFCIILLYSSIDIFPLTSFEDIK